MASHAKFTLYFSVKNPQKDCHYQIKVFSEDLSLGKGIGDFETEDKICLQEQNEIIFDQSIEYNFYFDKLQKLILKFIKKMRTEEGEINYKIKIAEIRTIISSLITSPDGIYERPLKNEESTTKDIFCIKKKKLIIIVQYLII